MRLSSMRAGLLVLISLGAPACSTSAAANAFNERVMDALGSGDWSALASRMDTPISAAQQQDLAARVRDAGVCHTRTNTASEVRLGPSVGRSELVCEHGRFVVDSKVRRDGRVTSLHIDWQPRKHAFRFT